MPKLTFSLDDETVETLRRRQREPEAAKPVVREAIAEYAARDTNGMSLLSMPNPCCESSSHYLGVCLRAPRRSTH